LYYFGYNDIKIFEDTVVDHLTKSLIHGDISSPIRLSTIAEKYIIKPVPEIRPGNKDGELVYNESMGDEVVLYSKIHIFIGK
jgi:hypothetical protein